MKHRSYRAFTLIELLVVIAIISILASILFPVFARAREQARKASCQSNLKQIGIAMMMYTQDYDEKYPFAANGGATGGKSNRWYDVVNPYVKSKQQVWICPTAGPLIRYGGTVDGYDYGGYAYNVAGGFYGPGASSYNRNPFTGVGIAGYGNGFGFTPPGNPQTPTLGPVSLAEVQEPSNTVIASDPCSLTSSAYQYRAEFLAAYQSSISYLPMLHGGPFDEDAATLQANLSGGGNYLFADGHVKYLQVSYAASHRDIFNVIKH